MIAAAPVTDTIKRVGERGRDRRDRAARGLWAAQTPQVFRAETLRRAHDGDPSEVLAATDDAMLVEAAGGRGAGRAVRRPNLKVTTAADLRLAAALLAAR